MPAPNEGRIASESLARSLASTLTGRGVAATVRRASLWSVDISAGGLREMWVNCVMARTPLFAVGLWDDKREVANGRTSSIDDVIACAERWQSVTTVAELCDATPFLTTDSHALRGLAARLRPELTVQLRGAHEHARLWAKSGDRDCIVRGSRYRCFFCVDNVQVASAEYLEDPVAALTAWMIDRVSVAELCLRIPGVHAEPLGQA